MTRIPYARSLLLIALLMLAAATGATGVPPGVLVQDYDSPSVDRRLKYAVLLPDGYDADARRYPLLILLHGHGGHYRSWITYAGLPADTATALGAIVVLADGGNGFYINWHGAEGDQPNRWEDAIIRDLLPEIERRWSTRRDRGSRAIGGLSMGGYGAVTIALRHPDVFGTAFSSAGALRFAEHAGEELQLGSEDWNRPERWSGEQNAPVPIAGFSSQRERTPRGRVFTTIEQARAADPFLLAGQLAGRDAPFVHLDCGLQDALLPQTQAFAAVLARWNLPHAIHLQPGGHDVPYWMEAFERTAAVLRVRFAKARNSHRD